MVIKLGCEKIINNERFNSWFVKIRIFFDLWKILIGVIYRVYKYNIFCVVFVDGGKDINWLVVLNKNIILRWIRWNFWSYGVMCLLVG